METKRSKTEMTDQNNNNNTQNDTNNEYFDSYVDLEVHQLMIADKPRTLGYLEAIKKNQDKFEGKVVMDVGCGTGILSMFCAKFGKAKKVIAVEKSGTSFYAKQLVEKNGLSNVVTVRQSAVEDLKIDEKVDIIISEWMGFYLFHEGMLDSVIYARDHYLKQGGMLFPQTATLFCAPCTLDNFLRDKVYFWNDDLYGLDFTPLQQSTRFQLSQKPQVEIISVKELVTKPQIVIDLDLTQTSLEDLQQILAMPQFACKAQLIDGFCIWFDVEFPGNVVLSTGPDAAPTHWKQTLIVLPQPIVSEAETLNIELSLEKMGRRYQLNLGLQGHAENEDEEDEEGEDTVCGNDDYDPDCDCPKCRLIRALDEQYAIED